MSNKILAIYPGRFQLPHKGHKFVYDFLCQKFDDVYVATSDKVELPRSPFKFDEKRVMLANAGVPISKIVKCISPNRPEEITKKFPDDITLIIAAGEKVQEEENRYSFKPKRDGSPSYFQPYEENKNNLLPITTHAYIILVPTKHFSIMGKPAKSASEMRALFKTLDPDKQKKFITELYGKYSLPVHKILKKLMDI